MAEQQNKRVRVISGAHGVTLRATLGLLDAIGTTFESLGWTLGAVRARRRLSRLLDEAGHPVPIAGASEGVIRIEGRVELLDSVDDEHGDAVAAFLVRETRDEACGCQSNCTAIKRWVTTRGNAGRFMVRDAGGVALVIGPRLRLLDFRGQPVDPFEAGALRVRDGDLVTVLGSAANEVVEESRARPADGYRGTRTTPVFRAVPEIPVHVFCARS